MYCRAFWGMMTGGAGAAAVQAVPLASLRSGVHRCPATGATWPAVEVLCPSMLPGGGGPSDQSPGAAAAPGSRDGASAGGSDASGRAADTATKAPAGVASGRSEACGTAAAAAAAPAGGWLQPGVRARTPATTPPHGDGAAAGGSGLPACGAAATSVANAEQQPSSSGSSALVAAPADGSAGASC